MSAVDDRFQQLRAAGEKAFIPFITAGDPDLKFTQRLLLQLSESGASVIEVGFPYSDPIADGPVIQASYTRALDHRVTVEGILAAVAEVAEGLQAPLVAMVSYAIILRHGAEKFVRAARTAGFSGAIVPDLPVEESQALQTLCRAQDFSLIQLVTPTTPRERAVSIAQASTGFLYYVSVAGITGERRDLPPELAANVAWLRQQTDLPICIGFGISQVEHVKLLAPVADGLIVGSAIVRRFDPEKSQDAVVAEVADLVAELRSGLRSS